jgi:hypothetical protein
VVVGIDKFREYFVGHEDEYVLIGGAACDLLFATAGLDFRATRDLDVVLCVEVVSHDFAKTFLEFVEAGGYEARQQQDGRKGFFRFHKPADPAFPYMIELFSRQAEGIDLPADFRFTKVPVDDEIISLSAILLDNDYYAALLGSRVVVNGISLLSEALLIPFKAKAFLDLTERRMRGEDVDRRTITKHRNDVFRLLQLLSEESRIDLAEPIRQDLRAFLNLVAQDDTFDPRSFRVQLAPDEGIDLLAEVYALR